jgi:ATP-dependent RNA helicase RhlE
MEFLDLGLDPKVCEAVVAKGYQTPTSIQNQAIPAILSGKDVLGCSQTGTGKTAAFALPLLSLIRKRQAGGTRCLILTPTRELANQIYQNFEDYGTHLNVKSCVIYGGVSYGNQRRNLTEKPDIVIATPGRLLQYLKEKFISLNALQFLVLDEVDRMLDLGFINDVRSIVSFCPKKRQTILFSATFPPSIKALTSWVLQDPVEIRVDPATVTAKTVEHEAYPVDSIQKFDLLRHLLTRMEPDSAIVFTRTKVDADCITRWLKQAGHKVAAMHADRSQNERQQALKSFREGAVKILVATDIASRGLDVKGIKHVINYSVPHNPEDYVHRIGRTGRAKSEGKAYTLVASEDSILLKAIEKFIKGPISLKVLEDFAYTRLPHIPTTVNVSKKRNRGYRYNNRSR